MRNNQETLKLRMIVLIFVLCLIFLSGCRKNESRSVSDNSFHETSSELTVDQGKPNKEFSGESSEKQLHSDQPEPSVTRQRQSRTQPESTASQIYTLSEQTAENSKPKAPAENVESEVEPVVKNAVAEDAIEIADKLIQDINKYRIEQGIPAAVRLSGLTKYAEYRSRQLVKNFAHDTKDERAAAMALKYGMYTNPLEFGVDDEPFYSSCAREAIAKAGYIGTIDSVAEEFGILVRNSPGHWSYVGSADYSYIAVGITYDSEMWYCDIAMSDTNAYEN